MGLVEYSESEGSDEGDRQEADSRKPTQKTGKPAFKKVVDRSNPHKIRVNLPEQVKDPADDKEDENEPPAKKAKIGGGAFSGFNSFLPAPKRSAAVNGALKGAGAGRVGLGSGVSLKTGSAPGFSREPVIDYGLNVGDVEGIADRDDSLQENTDPLESRNVEKSGLSGLPESQSIDAPLLEPKKQGNPMMFKPLSVARKSQKKKPAVTNGGAAFKSQDIPPAPRSKATARVSLFSTEPSQDVEKNGSTASGAYQPMIYGADEPDISDTGPQAANSYVEEHETPTKATPQISGTESPQSLDTIASDLNLSASAKRQLFGRQKPNTSAINVVNFNTDQEYAANELLRQAGEQVQHNPVRAIAPGKHSLKQLVNAASNQKDALEEHFASGRRNKKEAGSKYGW